MKTNKFWLVAALTATFVLAGCEKETPFDTQSQDDQPRILVPYETKDGQIHSTVYNPAPYVDSVIVTPSAYTTVYWYVDKVLVNTGTKINMNFPTGTYDLLIEAVTTTGKRTTRTGDLSVRPADTDPASPAPAAGRHLVPNTSATLSGANLTQVKKLILSRDMYSEDTVCTIAVSTTDDASLTFNVPALPDGKYYLRLQDAEGHIYGADVIEIHNASVALSGFSELTPNKEWVITGVDLANVASVKVDEITITELVATETTVTLTAPDVAVGEHTVSMKNSDGSDVLFITEEGAVAQAKTVVSEETTLWTGPNYLLWNENRVRIESSDMAQVPAGSVIFIYYEKLPAGHEGYYEGDKYNEYWKMKVMTAWWTDLFPEFEVTDETANPYSFTYTEDMKAKVDEQNALSVAGWGLNINKITYK